MMDTENSYKSSDYNISLAIIFLFVGSIGTLYLFSRFDFQDLLKPYISYELWKDNVPMGCEIMLSLAVGILFAWICFLLPIRKK